MRSVQGMRWREQEEGNEEQVAPRAGPLRAWGRQSSQPPREGGPVFIVPETLLAASPSVGWDAVPSSPPAAIRTFPL